MSRRDTIIIAVLINAGLLVVLFSTALKSSKSEELAAVATQQQMPSAQVTEIPVQREITVANTPQDEVDQLLRQFSQPIATEVPQTLPVAAVVSEPKNDFAQDINGLSFSQPATPVVETAQPVSKAPTPVSTPVEVVVKKGDVLEKIARTHHTTVDAIMKMNHLTSTRLKIGQVLKVTADSQNKTQSTEKSEGSPKYYTVKKGDSPWTIAVKNHMKVDELLRLNNLDADKAKRLKPGDQLRIR